MNLTPDERKAVARFNRGTGCEYPALPCYYCAALIAGMRGEPAPETRDGDVRTAWRRGMRAYQRRSKEAE